MTSTPGYRPRRGRLTAFALAGTLQTGLLMAATVGDRLPADDPTNVPRAHQSLAPASTQPEVEAGSVIGSAVGAIFNTLAWTASALISLPYGVNQATWEASYIAGVNQTPLARPKIDEPYPAVDRGDGRFRTATPIQPATTATAPTAAAPPPATTALAPTRPLLGYEEVDRALLANFIYDRGSRQEDGSYFVPKPLQRLFQIRTERAKMEPVPTTVRIAGRIIPDPQMHGTVQPTIPGRLEPPDEGFPVLGQAVTQGEVLAWVSPSVGVVDRTQVRRDVARLTTDIRVETEQLELLKQFSFVPFRDGKIYQAEQRIAGLRRERDALLPLLQVREALRAPADGVISVMRAIIGRVVPAGDPVFEIIDPARLWIEATAPDPNTATLASEVQSASAVTADGVSLALTFVGTGLSLAQQSAPVMFRIDNPPAGLRVGRPVTVDVRSNGATRMGVAVPRTAVTSGTDGILEVWEQTQPEIFLPHPVQTIDVDGTTALVVNGLTDGAKIVVRGTRILAQLQ